MTKDDHLEHLIELELQGDSTMEGFGLAMIKKEGAFYFGDLMTPAEHAVRYREECVKRGWLD